MFEDVGEVQIVIFTNQSNIYFTTGKMDECDLCRSALNCSGKQLQCPDCKKVLCVSCGELKSKLHLMTSGYGDTCTCILLQELEVNKKQETVHNTAENQSYSGHYKSTEDSSDIRHVGKNSKGTESRHVPSTVNTIRSKSVSLHEIPTKFDATDQIGPDAEVTDKESNGQNELMHEERITKENVTKKIESRSTIMNVDSKQENVSPDTSKEVNKPSLENTPDKKSHQMQIAHQSEPESLGEFTNNFSFKITTSYGVQTDRKMSGSDGSSAESKDIDDTQQSENVSATFPYQPWYPVTEALKQGTGQNCSQVLGRRSRTHQNDREDTSNNIDMIEESNIERNILSQGGEQVPLKSVNDEPESNVDTDVSRKDRYRKMQPYSSIPQWIKMPPPNPNWGNGWGYNEGYDQPWGMFSDAFPYGEKSSHEFTPYAWDREKTQGKDLSSGSHLQHDLLLTNTKDANKSAPLSPHIHTQEIDNIKPQIHSSDPPLHASFSSTSLLTGKSSSSVKTQPWENEHNQLRVETSETDDSLKKHEPNSIKEDVAETSKDSETGRKIDVSLAKREKSSPSTKYKKKLSKHTCAGCGRRDCEGQFMKLMKAMTLAAKNNNFIVHNVVPDGNCMFAAIVDQLEINSDYSFSSKSLRQACVEHLKNNPESDDGTHYEMFMDRESWTEYLDRMSQEGQWGDHLMLQAISQVTRRNIEVLHAGEKEEITKITTALAKENQRCLRLGHVGEFHYVSLREIQEDIGNFSSEEEDDVLFSLPLNSLSIFEDTRKRDMFVEDYIDPFCDIPSLHLSFLFKNMLPVNVALNEADRFKHTAMSLEYKDFGHGIPRDTEGDGLTTEKEAKISMHKAIGDIVNGLYIDCTYLKGKHKGTRQLKNNFLYVPVLWVHSSISTCRKAKELRDTKTCPVVIKTDETHPGYANLMTYYPWQWSDDREGPVYVSNHHPVFIPPVNQQSDEAKDKMPSTNPVVLFYSKTIPALHSEWPEEAQEWLKRKRPSNWPPAYIISTIEADGCHLVNKAHPHSSNSDIEFRFCFGVAERTLCEEALSRDQRYCLLVFLELCSHGLGGSTSITKHHLKRVFFYACEELPVDCWASNMGSCLFYLLESLISQLEQKNIPCYFIRQNNTIDYLKEEQINETREKIGILRGNPLQYLLSIANDSESGLEVQQMIMEDMAQFKLTHNVRESVLNCFIPYAIKMARAYILQRRFKTAMDTLQTAYEDRLTVATCDDQVPFQSFFSEAVQGIPFDSQWWFLLYSDEKLGMTMSSDLSLNQQPVTLGELVGPSIAKDYASHLIPQSMAYERCQLFTNFAWFLLTKYRTQQAVEYLLLCITSYKDKLDLEINPNCTPESLEQYHDFNERTMYKVLVYLYYALYRQKLEHTFINYFDIVDRVCERLDCREAYYQAQFLAQHLDEHWSKHWAQRYHSCKKSDPSINYDLFIDTIQNPE